jgi:hypothetical protein
MNKVWKVYGAFAFFLGLIFIAVIAIYFRYLANSPLKGLSKIHIALDFGLLVSILLMIFGVLLFRFSKN